MSSWPTIPGGFCRNRPDLRSNVVAPTNQLADKFAGLLEPELRDVDREVAARALLTLAYRLRQANLAAAREAQR
jgi:hypothetical protein